MVYDENLTFAGMIRSSFGRSMHGGALPFAGFRSSEVNGRAQLVR